jgi:hypothetical protein
MNSSATPPMPVVLASFFKRLEPLDSIIKASISNASLSALLTFRGDPQKKVLLDLTKSPGRVLVDEQARGGHISVTVRGDVMHDILLTRMTPGVAVGRREMLLRGSAVKLAKFTPLFEIGPALYREHLADIGFRGFSRKPGETPFKEAVMSGQQFTGEPIPLVQLSALERVVFALMRWISYALGYGVGLMRYRVFKRMNLFDVLASMSRGLTAATPKQILDGAKAGE